MAPFDAVRRRAPNNEHEGDPGQREFRMAKRRRAEEAPVDETAEAAEVVVRASSDRDAAEATGWQVVVNKTTTRKVDRAKMQIEAIREKAIKNAKGLFRVTIARSVQHEQDGVTVIKAEPFEANLLSLCREVFTRFPSARPESKNGFIHVWTDSKEVAKRVSEVKSLTEIPVKTRCPDLEFNRARISGVDRGFSDDEIRSALAASGVVDVKRESYKRRVGDNVSLCPTDRVLLEFDRIPPATVFLAFLEHKVVLHAGQPISCFKCQRFNHTARFCPYEQSCRNCGRPDHVQAQCSYRSRCVNCRGPHAASSVLCPLRACEIEKRKVRMETRLMQQLKANNPEAKAVQVINAAVSAPNPTDPEAKSATSSYAAAVKRSLVVEADDGPTITLNLPNETTIPCGNKKKKLKKQKENQKPATKSSRPQKERPEPPASQLGSELKPAIRLLRAICPEVAKALQILLNTIEPLMKALQSIRPFGATEQTDS